MENKTPPKFFVLNHLDSFFVFVKISEKTWNPVINVKSQEDAEEIIKVLKLYSNLTG